MTSSVVTSRDCGMVSPIALATLRLITCLRWAGLLDWHPQALHRSVSCRRSQQPCGSSRACRPIGHQKTARRRVILFENETHSLAVNHVI